MAQQKVLLVVPVGSPPPALLKAIEEPLAAQLGLTVQHAKISLQRPAYAFNKDRGQYHSNAIMRRLVPLMDARQGHVGVLGVADVDLFVPDAPFVFGEADRESKSAVLSIARLLPGADFPLLQRRMQAEAVHLGGHLVGLSYCEDARCAMFHAQSTQDTDRKAPALCNLCRNELQKLNR